MPSGTQPPGDALAPSYLPPFVELLRERLELLRPETDWEVHGGQVRGGRLWASVGASGTHPLTLGIGEPNPDAPLRPVLRRADDDLLSRVEDHELPWWQVDGPVELSDAGAWSRWTYLARPVLTGMVLRGAVVGDRRICFPMAPSVAAHDEFLLAVAFVLLDHWHPEGVQAVPHQAPASDAEAIAGWLRALRGRRQVESPSDVEPWRRALQDEERLRHHLIGRVAGLPEALRTQLVREAATRRCADVLVRVPLGLAVVRAWAGTPLDGLLAARLAMAADPRLWSFWLARAWAHDSTRARAILAATELDLGSPESLRALEEALRSTDTSALRGLGTWLADRARPTEPHARATLARVLLQLPWEGADILRAVEWVGEEAVVGILLDAIRAGSELPTHRESGLRAAQARALLRVQSDPTAVVMLVRHAPHVAQWLDLDQADPSVQRAILDVLEASRLPADVALLQLVEHAEDLDVKLRAVALLGATGGSLAFRELQAWSSQWFLPRRLARAYRSALAQIQDRTHIGGVSLADMSGGGGLAVADAADP